MDVPGQQEAEGLYRWEGIASVDYRQMLILPGGPALVGRWMDAGGWWNVERHELRETDDGIELTWRTRFDPEVVRRMAAQGLSEDQFDIKEELVWSQFEGSPCLLRTDDVERFEQILEVGTEHHNYGRSVYTKIDESTYWEDALRERALPRRVSFGGYRLLLERALTHLSAQAVMDDFIRYPGRSSLLRYFEGEAIPVIDRLLEGGSEEYTKRDLKDLEGLRASIVFSSKYRTISEAFVSNALRADAKQLAGMVHPQGCLLGDAEESPAQWSTLTTEQLLAPSADENGEELLEYLREAAGFESELMTDIRPASELSEWPRFKGSFSEFEPDAVVVQLRVCGVDLCLEFLVLVPVGESWLLRAAL